MIISAPLNQTSLDNGETLDINARRDACSLRWQAQVEAGFGISPAHVCRAACRYCPMKTLWTPWRMSHIETAAKTGADCLFDPPGTCRFSKKHLLLFRDHSSLCLMNRFPYTNGHLLVAPARHISCITELGSAEMEPLMNLVSQATSILKKHLRPDGFNVGLNLGSEAGAGIAEHLHFHIVPRWRGDHNFITVLAEVRTIPEHIETTFDRLLPDFQAYHQLLHDQKQ